MDKNLRRCVACCAGAAAVLVVTSCLHPPALAADTASPPKLIPKFKQSKGKPTSAEELFAALDADGNGLIDRAEWKTRKMAIFYMRDVNGDTQLSRDEFPGIAADVFAKADLNGDGMLSGYEFNQAEFAQFEAAATGAAATDGISFAAFKAYVESLGRRK